MCLLGGREIFDWLGVRCAREACVKEAPSVALPVPPSPSSIPLQQTSQKETMNEEEEQPFDAANKSDSYILELTENGLKSLQGKLEIVIVAKREKDAFFYWEFPLCFSQSKLGGRTKPSNACTLISMSIAEAFFNDVNLSDLLRFDRRREGFTQGEQIAMNFHRICPPELIRVMKDAITKGNTIYDEERNRKNNSVFYTGKKSPLKDILTIPDAIMARNRRVEKSQWVYWISHRFAIGSGAAKEIKDHSVMNEVDFIAVKESVGKSLFRFAKYAIKHPSLSEWNIFCFIVICNEKAVSLIYRKDTDLFCLLDSHAHDRNTTGAVIAISSLRNFPKMAEWMEKKFFMRDKTTKTQKFELSLLQLRNDKAISPINPNAPIKTLIYHQAKPSTNKSPSNVLKTSSFLDLTQSSIGSDESGYESEGIPTH